LEKIKPEAVDRVFLQKYPGFHCCLGLIAYRKKDLLSLVKGDFEKNKNGSNRREKVYSNIWKTSTGHKYRELCINI